MNLSENTMKIKRNFLLLLLLVVLSTLSTHAQLNLVPYPKSIELRGKNFALNSKITVDAGQQFVSKNNFVKGKVEAWNKVIGNKNGSFKLNFILDNSVGNGNEAYHLSVKPEGITIKSPSEAGFIYAIQTIDQLMLVSDRKTELPSVEITDYPNFAWRSFMLDECRHFMGKAFVLGILDDIAALKINKFHWHLTDDAGWRIEIKKYPKLTEVGAFRDSTQINFENKKWKSTRYDGKPHGGFYTQEDIKEVIAYAKDRNIQVIPEIEMPGHSSAAIAAYPWLGVIGKLKSVPTYFGKLPDSYNISNPKVTGFLHDVLDEVCDLFPSDVIHIGGDEVLFDAWRESTKMQEYMAKHKLKSPADAQIKFTNDISNYLAGKGKRMMGWNEIMGANVHEFENADDYQVATSLAPGTIIHFWRGDVDQITKAANDGYAVVNSTHTNTYLDYGYQNSSLQKMYSFNPIPDGLAAEYHKNIIGVGSQMWTEWTSTYKEVEYQVFPRIGAIAEVSWSGTGNYPDFVKRLKIYSQRWEQEGRNFPAGEIK